MKQFRVNINIALINSLLIAFVVLTHIGCTRSVTRYRLQREPIYATVPIQEKRLVLTNYKSISETTTEPDKITSLAFIPFSSVQKIDSVVILDLNQKFKELLLIHENYSKRLVFYDDELLTSLLGTNYLLQSDETIDLINNNLGIENIVTGIVNFNDPFEFEFKLYNKEGLSSFLLKDTEESTAFVDAIEILYNGKKPVYAYDSIITGYKPVLDGYADSWISYENSENSAFKSFLFWTISTASLTTAAVIYEYDFSDLIKELDIGLDL